MPFATGLSENPVAATAAADVVDQVSGRLGTGPDVAMVFFTRPHLESAQEIGSVIKQRLQPMALVGAGAESVVADAFELEEQPAISLWAARLGGAQPVRFSVRRDNGTLAIDGPPAATLATAHTLVLISDPFTFPADGLVAHVAAEHPHLLVIGGLASAAFEPGGNRLLLDDEMFASGAVGLLLSGATRVTTVVSQGCRPIGKPLVVTKADRNVILELAGQPAYRQLVGMLEDLTEEERALAARGLHIGRVVDELKSEFVRGDFLIRGVLGVDASTGAITVGDLVPVGATVQFQVRDAASAAEDLQALIDGRSADSALLFTCNGRGLRLFSEPHHDSGLVSKMLDAVPTAGMFCAGEVGPVGGRSFIHGYTASLALFHEP